MKTSKQLNSKEMMKTEAEKKTKEKTSGSDHYAAFPDIQQEQSLNAKPSFTKLLRSLDA